MSVLCYLEKTTSLVPKLSPKVVVTDNGCEVIRCASGTRMEALFHQFIDNGIYIYAMSNRGININSQPACRVEGRFYYCGKYVLADQEGTDSK